MKKYLSILFSFAFLLSIIFPLTSSALVVYNPEDATPTYDQFAQCLSEEGATFYGAFWCPHCQDQKKLFGPSSSILPYVECSTTDGNAQTQICIDKNISAYPTWTFKDGSVETGKVSLEKLAEKTSCALPNESSCLDLKNNMRYRNRDVNTNGEVSSLQDFLQGKGYLNNEPTGYFGILTTKAVIEFQKANNISPAVGYVGSVTRAKIKALSCGYSTPTSTPINVVPGNILYPAGCTANTRYSATTGESCNGTNPVCPTGTTGIYPNCVNSSDPSVTVLYPNGGEVFKPGQIVTVRWQTKNIPHGMKAAIIINDNTNGIGGFLVENTLNDGTEVVTLPDWEGSFSGKFYKIRISFSSFDGYEPNLLSDASDNLFTINSICSTGQIGRFLNCKDIQSPTVSMIANPNVVSYGAQTTLTWNSTGATSCNAQNAWTGNRSLNGTQVISNITASATYSITCTGPGGSTTFNLPVKLSI